MLERGGGEKGWRKLAAYVPKFQNVLNPVKTKQYFEFLLHPLPT